MSKQYVMRLVVKIEPATRRGRMAMTKHLECGHETTVYHDGKTLVIPGESTARCIICGRVNNGRLTSAESPAHRDQG